MNANRVSKIWLFTVAACPTGRNIGTVLKELQAQHAELEFATQYFDMQPEMANRYRIKENPTVLFLNSEGLELYRFVGFKETTEVNRLIEQVENGDLQSEGEQPENAATCETYTIFLYRENQPVPVEVQYQNPTSVRTPRITAIQLLISAHVEGYENPFPPGARLNLVQFPHNEGQVYITVNTSLTESTREKMQALLTKTLEAFGVGTVKMILERSFN